MGTILNSIPKDLPHVVVIASTATPTQIEEHVRNIKLLCGKMAQSFVGENKYLLGCIDELVSKVNGLYESELRTDISTSTLPRMINGYHIYLKHLFAETPKFCVSVPTTLPYHLLQIKVAGNNHFRRGELNKALSTYTTGINRGFEYAEMLKGKTSDFEGDQYVHKFSPSLFTSQIAVFFSNRGIVKEKMNEIGGAIIDFFAAIECLKMIGSTEANILTGDSKLYTKVRYRLCESYSKLGNFGYASYHCIRGYFASRRGADKDAQLHKMILVQQALGDEMKTGKYTLYNFHSKIPNFHRFCVLGNIDKQELSGAEQQYKQRLFSSVCTHEQKAYLFGGHMLKMNKHGIPNYRGSGSGYSFYNDMFCVDVRESTMSKIKMRGEVPTARSGHSTVVFNDEIYLFGGLGEFWTKKKFGYFFKYNIKNRTWKSLPNGPLPCSLYDHSAIVHENKYMVIYGGRMLKKRKWKLPRDIDPMTEHFFEQTDVYAYNFETAKWSRWFKYDHKENCTGKALYPLPRYRHVAFYLNGAMYIWGGELIQWSSFIRGKHNEHISKEEMRVTPGTEPIMNFGDLWRFDLKTKAWTEILQVGNVPSRRSEFHAMTYNNSGYFYGGYAHDFHFTTEESVLKNGKKKKNKKQRQRPSLVPCFRVYRDCYQLSIRNVPEITKHEISDLMKLKEVGHWRLVKYRKDPAIIPAERADTKIFAFKRRIYLFGGYNDSDWSNSNAYRDLFRLKLEKEYLKECNFCLEIASKLKCGVCKTYYCSQKCQRKDWRHHKKYCKKL